MTHLAVCCPALSVFFHLKFFSSYVGFRAKAMAPNDSKIVDLASVSFSMVCHPLERLVSAYKDKVSPTEW